MAAYRSGQLFALYVLLSALPNDDGRALARALMRGARHRHRSAIGPGLVGHLRRHFKKVEKLSPAEPVGLATAFTALIDEAFAQYATWQQSAQREVFDEWAAGFKLRVHTAIGLWLPKASYEAGKLLRSLRDKASQWWYFLYDPSVRPDNNLSERNLRLAVTRRKVSGGSRTMDRFAQTADLLSVVQTCRRQYRSAMEFFVKALQANSHASFKTPSLIPKPNT